MRCCEGGFPSDASQFAPTPLGGMGSLAMPAGFPQHCSMILCHSMVGLPLGCIALKLPKQPCRSTRFLQHLLRTQALPWKACSLARSEICGPWKNTAFARFVDPGRTQLLFEAYTGNFGSSLLLVGWFVRRRPHGSCHVNAREYRHQTYSVTCADNQ